MKAKLLLMLFLVSLSLGVFALEHHQKKPHAVCKVYEKVATRIPFIFSEIIVEVAIPVPQATSIFFMFCLLFQI